MKERRQSRRERTKVASEIPMERPSKKGEIGHPIKFSIVSRGKWDFGAGRNWNCYEVHAKIAEIEWPCSGHNKDVTRSKSSVFWKQWAAKINLPKILSVCTFLCFRYRKYKSKKSFIQSKHKFISIYKILNNW